MPRYRESYLFVIMTDVPAVLWTGHTDLELPADDVFDSDVVALGAGELINLPDLEGLINGTAQRLEIVLSGVAARTIALAAEEADQVPGAAVHIGRIDFDTDWQVAGPVEWTWYGEGQKLAVGSDPSDTGRVRTLTLTVAAGDITRARAPLSFFTAADQHRDFPDDDVFNNVADIEAGTSRRWGPAKG